jgi:CRISPR system Cascade subunit CasA
MKESYNLVDNAWLPCVYPGGTIEQLTLLDTLIQAHEIDALFDDSPLVTVSLHRLLLAIVHRIFGPETPEIWGKLWQDGTGKWDEEQLRAYLCTPEVYPRFDLFNERYPFYQTASLPLGPIDPKSGRHKYVRPVWKMAHEVAYSDSGTLFSHITDDDWIIVPPGQAARWLVAFHSFALGGRITFAEGEDGRIAGSADAGPLVKSAVVLARGANLFQTLMLNFVHYSATDEEPFPSKAGADKPAWEREEQTQAEDRRYAGYLDLLTWQSRRVKLIPQHNADGRLLGVAGFVAMKGTQLPDRYWRKDRETMVIFLKKEKAKPNEDPWPPLGFREDRALWRDCHALFQSGAEWSDQPRVLKWINELTGRFLKRSSTIPLAVFGVNSNQAKVNFWRHETLPLPLVYLERPELVEQLKRALAIAEDGATKALRAAAWAGAAALLAANAEQKPDTDRVRAVVEALAPERLYWSRLERPFRELLVHLPGDAAHQDVCLRDWFRKTIRDEAHQAYEQTLGRHDSGRELKAVNQGRGVLFSRLQSIETEARISEPQEGEVT